MDAWHGSLLGRWLEGIQLRKVFAQVVFAKSQKRCTRILVLVFAAVEGERPRELRCPLGESAYTRTYPSHSSYLPLPITLPCSLHPVTKTLTKLIPRTKQASACKKRKNSTPHYPHPAPSGKFSEITCHMMTMLTLRTRYRMIARQTSALDGAAARGPGQSEPLCSGEGSEAGYAYMTWTGAWDVGVCFLTPGFLVDLWCGIRNPDS
ncbi:hypothetical protein P154DRAFT_162454 [Amniculicola lignicola CBS 123094]|uniref:Uncharacterized protein n=1 Tax=Amniculicola lignicola CBS 123094 TaxID=1392246 RepID=A0A6A5WNM8_9PLEO|nr:hypothetical protein P154DRAFT_162454 [Amniculicola lignicola CBS 123094]